MKKKKIGIFVTIFVVVVLGMIGLSRNNYLNSRQISHFLEQEENKGNAGTKLVVVTPKELDVVGSIQEENEDVTLLRDVCEGSLNSDVMHIKAAMIRQKIDYLVVKNTEGIEDYMSSIDCVKEKTTGTVSLYKAKNNAYERITDENKVQKIIEDTGLVLRDVEISLSGKSSQENAKEKEILGTYMLLNDQHMLLTTDDTTEEFANTINQRYLSWALTSTGTHSADTWQNISAILDSFGTDGILMAGDMVDFASSTNYDLFARGLEKVKTPVLYARADHDMSPWYNSDGSYTKDMAKASQKEITQMEDLMIWDKEQYLIIAWNNSTGQLTKKALKEAKKAFGQKKPIILVTHVPVNSTIDNGLYEKSKEMDVEHRAKLWGEGCYYEPNKTTKEFLDMVTEEDSPVCAILCGHLHFRYDTKVNNHCVEYVFDPTYLGNIARITIVR